MAPIEALGGRPSINERYLVYPVDFENFHPFWQRIKFGDPQVFRREGFTQRRFVFLNTSRYREDGCEYIIDPYGSSFPVRLLNRKKYRYEFPVSGSGFLLRYTLDGKIETYQFSKEILMKESYVMTSRDTDVSVWISNGKECPNEPFCVVRMSAPPFEPSDEEILHRRSAVNLLYEFWNQYDALKCDAKPLDPFTPLPR